MYIRVIIFLTDFHTQRSFQNFYPKNNAPLFYVFRSKAVHFIIYTFLIKAMQVFYAVKKIGCKKAQTAKR